MVAEPTRSWIAWEAQVQPNVFRRKRFGRRESIGRKNPCAARRMGRGTIQGTRNSPSAGILAPDSGMAGVKVCGGNPLEIAPFLAAVEICPGELDMGLVNYWPGCDTAPKSVFRQGVGRHLFPSYAPRFPEVAWTELGPRR